MAPVVGVHGVGAQLRGEGMLIKEWQPALLDGLRRADGTGWARARWGWPSTGTCSVPPASRWRSGTRTTGPATSSPVSSGAAARVVEGGGSDRTPSLAPGADTLARTPGSVQAALRALSHSKFFGGLALRTLVFDLKQVRRYLTDPELRAAARARVTHLIGPDTQVVVGHSLGSVVAYEALYALNASDTVRARRMGEGIGCARWSRWGHRSASGT